MKPIKSCLSISCPERFSTCCGAISVLMDGPHGVMASYYACSTCLKPFGGGECTAGEEPMTQKKGWEDKLDLILGESPPGSLKHERREQLRSLISQTRQDAVRETEERLGKGATARAWYMRGVKEERERMRRKLISFRHPRKNDKLEQAVKDFDKHLKKDCGFSSLKNLSGTIDTVICVLLASLEKEGGEE